MSPSVRKTYTKGYLAAWYHDPLDWLDEVVDGIPIGFCQFYDYWHSGEDWHGDTEMDGTGTYSIDYLIGDTDYLNKGLGKAIVMALVAKVQEQPSAKQIIVQPKPENKASCGALLSSGFTYDTKNEIYVMELAVGLA